MVKLVYKTTRKTKDTVPSMNKWQYKAALDRHENDMILISILSDG
jgi:hypothetical protein